MATAPARGRAIGATAIQIFTKTPNQWRESALDRAAVRAFREAMDRNGIATAVSHDSYLINLASPVAGLRRRSERAFTAELRRAEVLGLPFVVSHPGNFIDDRRAGLRRNAESYARCLEAAPGRVRVAIETTAGSGTALGSTFEELAVLERLMPGWARRRVDFCADTCHLWAAGYDIVRDLDGVLAEFDRLLGLERLACLHLNDARGDLGGRLDRHALIGEGRLGPEPFRQLMRDSRLAHVIRIIETPKGEDALSNDRRMLRRLRAYSRRPQGFRLTGVPTSFPARP